MHFILALLLYSLPTSLGAFECLETDSYFSNHLATKTAYRFVSNPNDSPIRFRGCEPKKLWVAIRHGSRYPGKKMITGMQKRLPELRRSIINHHNLNIGELCQETIANISLWSPQVKIVDNKRLVHEGEDEMTELAERFQNRFPELLPEEYTNSTYKFRFTATQRTMESKRYFTIGLFGRKMARYVWTPEPRHKDPILRFYKLCSKWQKEVDKNPDSLHERQEFENSDVMKTVVKNVSKRLGFTKDLQLSDVYLMYTTCAFESAWSPYHISPWCNIFARTEMEVLEYAEDLEYYWIDGYGYTINYKQACPILQDMLQHLTSEQEPTATFYFTHSGTLLKMLAHLGLYKDEKTLTHSTFDMKRAWRVGRIDSFATNLAFVLYECEDGPKVLTLHQERGVMLPGCEGELCSLKTIQELYHDSFYDCNFSDLCRLNT